MSEISQRKFPLGQFVGTPNALNQISQAEILAALQRHADGDWGDTCKEDAELNDHALVDGDRIVSVYHTKNGIKFWIITEADRSVTTVLMPEDY